ncbi:PDZ domain-containing protein [Alicyclobacillus dauci]|uniref:PDZ domain-containing protein n=1 Tax=Alicyclobacillus dauci TaxID=1475485 RepID=A0ABY6Z149_9BACL|nr:PDZ domain-containing protein [Alicyclobacillus dauci]WAH36604.1 PDZ domain-containing protein [Alicyclobacillus dauci]
MEKGNLRMHHWTVTSGLQLVLVALLTFLLNPLHYVITAFIIWDLVCNIRNERLWFGIRVTRIVKPLVVRYVKACVVGAVGSAALLALGAAVSWTTILFVTVLSLVLGAIRSRFTSSSFAISVAVTLAGVAGMFQSPGPSFLSSALRFLQGFETKSWLAIGVVAALAELLLQWWNKRDAVFPALMTSKRGRRIGALKIQLGFVMPLMLWMTPINHGAVTFFGGFHPWLTSPQTSLGICIIPVVFGLHGLFTALKPERVLVQWRWWNLAQAAVLAAGFAVEQWTKIDFGWLAAPVMIALIECVRSVWRRVDASSEPLIAPDNRGVMVLYTIRDSLSDKLGLLPGEIVTHVNQTPVHTEYDLHFAFDQNPAYAKFQIIDTRGEVRLVGNPVYEGERHQLGLIVVVPGEQPALALKRPLGFLETMYLRRNR